MNHDLGPRRTVRLKRSPRASMKDLNHLGGEEEPSSPPRHNLNPPDSVESLQRRLGGVRLQEMKPATRASKRASKRGMEPYEDAKTLIFHLLADPMTDRRERIVRLKKEIASLEEHREADMVYDRAIGLLEIAVTKQAEQIKKEEEESNRHRPTARTAN